MIIYYVMGLCTCYTILLYLLLKCTCYIYQKTWFKPGMVPATGAVSGDWKAWEAWGREWYRPDISAQIGPKLRNMGEESSGQS